MLKIFQTEILKKMKLMNVDPVLEVTQGAVVVLAVVHVVVLTMNVIVEDLTMRKKKHQFQKQELMWKYPELFRIWEKKYILSNYPISYQLKRGHSTWTLMKMRLTKKIY